MTRPALTCAVIALASSGCSAIYDFGVFSPSDGGPTDGSVDATPDGAADAAADADADADAGCACPCSSDGCVDGACVSGEMVVEVAAGSAHTCARTAAGGVFCWGRNDDGQLGVGVGPGTDAPAEVTLPEPARAVGAGERHSCAVLNEGAACWGSGEDGRLGRGTTAPSDVPVMVDTGPVGEESLGDRLDLGDRHGCALGADTGNAYCWGFGMDGRLGTGDSVNRLRPNRAGGFSFTEISAGADHTCALQSSGQVRCWGRDADEQLGNGAGTESNTPALVSGDRNYRSVSAGTLHTCAVETAGLLFCWGGGPAGQTGRPPGAGRNSVPSQVGTETSWLDVAAGVAHTCARFGDGEVFCFGNNARGALGTGDDIAVDGPTAVEGGVQMSQLSAGNQFTCGVAPGGELYCWGQNDVGQLGVGDRMDRMSPTRVCFGE